MKKIRFFLIPAFLLCLSACMPREYGNELGLKACTPVSRLKRHPENYIDKMVKIRGKVVEESSGGFWITVQDELVIIMVHFQDEPVRLPRILGREVEVEGQFRNSQGGYMLAGKFVRII